MQTRSKILDDVAQLMSNAMGVAQGAKTEAETAVKSLMDRWLAEPVHSSQSATQQAPIVEQLAP